MVATGRFPLFGYMPGGYAPLKDVYETDVLTLGSWRSHSSVTAIRRIEDEILERYIEGNFTPMQIIADGYDAMLVWPVIRSVNQAESSRRPAPLGPTVSKRAFDGAGWRMPPTFNGY